MGQGHQKRPEKAAALNGSLPGGAAGPALQGAFCCWECWRLVVKRPLWRSNCAVPAMSSIVAETFVAGCWQLLSDGEWFSFPR